MSLVEELVAQLRRGAPAPSPAALRRALALLLRGGARAAPEAHDHALLDLMLADCDRRLGAQLDAILHHPPCKRARGHLAQPWTRLIERVSFDDVDHSSSSCSCTKQDSAQRLRRAAPELTARRPLLQRVYRHGVRPVYGGRPYGIICADLRVRPWRRGDLAAALVRRRRRHGPRALHRERQPGAASAATASPPCPACADIAGALAGPRLRAWQALRDAEDARYVGLCLPRVLLRAALRRRRRPLLPLRYRESRTWTSDILWGPASMAWSPCSPPTRSRAYRWCVYVLGSRAAAVASQLRCRLFDLYAACGTATRSSAPSAPGSSKRSPTRA
jgi:type VI secretion system protein ImpC